MVAIVKTSPTFTLLFFLEIDVEKNKVGKEKLFFFPLVYRFAMAGVPAGYPGTSTERDRTKRCSCMQEREKRKTHNSQFRRRPSLRAGEC